MAMIMYCSKTDDGMIEDCVDDDLMIYDELNEKIYLLNQTSKIIWEFIGENTKIPDIENMLINLFNVPQDETEGIKKDIQEILAEWESNGLITVLKN